MKGVARAAAERAGVSAPPALAPRASRWARRRAPWPARPQNRKLAIEWFQKAGFLGNAQARYVAQHLLSRGNFVGFRNEQEEATVIPGKLRTGLLWEEPVGMLFRNSGERLAYIRNLRYRVDRYEAYQAWVLRKNEYDECKRGNRSSCSEPGPAPQ
jgi:hypothetical protein